MLRTLQRVIQQMPGGGASPLSDGLAPSLSLLARHFREGVEVGIDLALADQLEQLAAAILGDTEQQRLI